jgi:hypothetical protein
MRASAIIHPITKKWQTENTIKAIVHHAETDCNSL